MKVKLRTLYASPARVVAPGQVAELGDDEGKELIAAGYAEPVLGALQTSANTPTPPPKSPPRNSGRKGKR